MEDHKSDTGSPHSVTVSFNDHSQLKNDEKIILWQIVPFTIFAGLYNKGK